jgi:hypothetical protein
MTATLTQILGVLVSALAIGAWSIPAGVLVVGLALILFGVAAEKGR